MYKKQKIIIIIKGRGVVGMETHVFGLTGAKKKKKKKNEI